MADLVAQDDVEDLDRAQVAGPRAALACIGGVASSPRASSVRGTSAMRAMMSPRGALGHRPQAVVGREVAVVVAELSCRCSRSSVKCSASSAATLQPVAVVGVGHAGEAPDRVERQVDGVELDVRHRVQQRGAALGA